MRAVFMTHKGAVREENQDAVFVSGTVRTGDMDAPQVCGLDSKDRPILLAVVDGMGGYEGGALAAGIVAGTLAEQTENVFGADIDIEENERALRRSLAEAARRMKEEALKNSLLTEMGATVSGLLLRVREKSAIAFNCGDCRVYRLTGGCLERVTRDHSVVQALFEAEKIDEEEMRAHPQKNIVTSAVSADSQSEFELYVKRLSLCDGDSFFLCSDGVWEALSSLELTALLTRMPSQEAAREIFEALLAAKCRDNVSFIWVGFDAAK